MPDRSVDEEITAVADNKCEMQMPDRTIEEEVSEVPALPEELESILVFALEEAREKMASDAEVVPFTVLAVKDNLFIETHPGDSAEFIFAAARHTVENACGGTAYAFCYDGYVSTDAGQQDAIIAEGGLPGETDGAAAALIYHMDGDTMRIDDELVYIGPAPNFMEKLKGCGISDEAQVAEAPPIESLIADEGCACGGTCSCGHNSSDDVVSKSFETTK